MASTFRSFAEYGVALSSTLDDDALARMSNAAGMAGKKAATDEIRRVLGPDQAMSNMRLDRARAPRVTAGYDIRKPESVDVNMRPKGQIILSTKGRQNRGVIDTDRYLAVRTPQGPRAYSTYGPSRGTGLLGRARDDMAKDVPKAHNAAYVRELRKKMG